MTPAQLTTLKTDINADPAFAALKATADGRQAIADAYNLTAAPAFKVWQTAVPIDVVQDAIVYANMTPAAAVPTTTTLGASPTAAQNATYNNEVAAVHVWKSRALSAQGKQMNLQNLLLGRQSVNFAKANIRAAFQDCLTGLPTGAAGALQAAGWTALQTAGQRDATRAEKLYATGTGSVASPATIVFEGSVTGTDVETALNLP